MELQGPGGMRNPSRRCIKCREYNCDDGQDEDEAGKRGDAMAKLAMQQLIDKLEAENDKLKAELKGLRASVGYNIRELYEHCKRSEKESHRFGSNCDEVMAEAQAQREYGRESAFADIAHIIQVGAQLKDNAAEPQKEGV